MKPAATCSLSAICAVSFMKEKEEESPLIACSVHPTGSAVVRNCCLKRLGGAASLDSWLCWVVFTTVCECVGVWLWPAGPTARWKRFLCAKTLNRQRKGDISQHVLPAELMVIWLYSTGEEIHSTVFSCVCFVGRLLEDVFCLVGCLHFIIPEALLVIVSNWKKMTTQKVLCLTYKVL